MSPTMVWDPFKSAFILTDPGQMLQDPIEISSSLVTTLCFLFLDASTFRISVKM